MRKAVASAKCTGGQDGDGEDKVQDKRLCCWLKIHARDFSTDSKGPLNSGRLGSRFVLYLCFLFCGRMLVSNQRLRFIVGEGG